MEILNQTRASEHWGQVVNDFRRVCFLKREGKTQESETVLTVELPKSIALWSREEKRDGNAQRLALQEMFTQEERRVGDVWQLKSLLRDQLKAELMDQMREDLRKEFDAERKRISEMLAERIIPPAPLPVPAMAPEIPPASLEIVEEPPIAPPPRIIRPWKPQTMELPLRSTSPTPPPAQEQHPHRRPPLNDLAAVLDFVLAEQTEMATPNRNHVALAP